MYLGDPVRAVAELARVTRRGGCVVVAEPDYGALRPDHPDHEATRAIYETAMAFFQSPRVGSEVFRLMADAGLVERVLVAPVKIGTTLHRMSLSSFRYGTDAAVAVIREADDRGAYAAWAHRYVSSGRVSDRQARQHRAPMAAHYSAR